MARNFPNGSQPALASLVLVNHAHILFKQELKLAKRELTNELRTAKQAAVTLGVGIGIATFGALLLVFMLVYLLHWALSERLLPFWRCFGIVGTVLTILGTALFSLGKRNAGAVRPRLQTIATVRDNVSWITHRASGHNGPTRSPTT